MYIGTYTDRCIALHCVGLWEKVGGEFMGELFFFVFVVCSIFPLGRQLYIHMYVRTLVPSMYMYVCTHLHTRCMGYICMFNRPSLSVPTAAEFSVFLSNVRRVGAYRNVDKLFICTSLC